MSQQKVLFISQEITPYLPANEISEFCRQLPLAVQDKGFEVRMFMPKYGCINERRNQLHEVIRLSGMNLIIDDTDHPLIIKVATLQNSRMQVYFIDNDDYFQRHPAVELETVSHPDDNDERSIFFVRGVAETVKKLRWDPVIIHCSGWITAAAPAYLKRVYNDDPSFKKAKIVYSLMDDELIAPLDPTMQKKMKADGISDKQTGSIRNKTIDHAALCRLAMDHADAIVQARQNVNPELIEYARATGKPFMEYPGEGPEALKAYTDFYDTLLSTQAPAKK
ncbi:MAG: glycogen/starch synthase [Muribaculaceae bacterium]|nr:glycogen/starch synthase [Muribaculaceae bacterium]MDE5971709.1 glycogen/starch synthase [Muribaculaceae bacterium]MDE6462146.1 glycogen/starch synthase [Muribaculaceae bacterium]